MTLQEPDRLWLLTTIAAYPAQYRAELVGVPEAALRWKPSEREWSLAEVMAHLADTEEEYVTRRVLPILREDRPAIAGFDQDAWAVERRYNDQDPMENLARFARWNAELVRILWTLEDADWQRVGIHSERGPVTLAELVATLARHHASHLHQMRRVKLQYLSRA
ncbi:MAG: DinB family protein [Firmicutes bacterium]|nr:DinB family protein [Bacillota bacterium]